MMEDKRIYVAIFLATPFMGMVYLICKLLRVHLHIAIGSGKFVKERTVYPIDDTE